MSDLISRDVVLANISERLRANGYGNVGLVSELNRLIGYVKNIPSAETSQNLARPNKELKGSDIISRQDAIDALGEEPEIWNDTEEEWAYRNAWVEHISAIKSLPSADRPTTDCTKFLEWLKAEVLDEENWELNAVANGEIICRKFKKLGWLDVEDGYYVDTRPTGEWIWSPKDEDGTVSGCCSNCSFSHLFIGGHTAQYNYCPNCGAKMKGGTE